MAPKDGKIYCNASPMVACVEDTKQGKWFLVPMIRADVVPEDLVKELQRETGRTRESIVFEEEAIYHAPVKS